MTFPWLTLIGLVPIVGALIAFFLKGNAAKYWGLAVSLITLGLTACLALQFSPSTAGLQFSEVHSWIPSFGAFYALGLDGLGLLMVVLAAVLTPIVILAEWNMPEQVGRWNAGVYLGLVLMLESFSLFVFMSTDVLLFYLFFEATLIPMYFLIAGFGGSQRSRAAIKFLLFSLAGGLIMLASIIGIYVVSAAQLGGQGTYLLTSLETLHLSGTTARWLMLGFLIAFIIKAPMVPAHTWLPEAAEQSTPGIATMLVGVMDKIGTFGMIRFCVGLFPEASNWIAPFMMIFALVSIIYGAICAIGQHNLMRFVAFTSVSHFGFMVLGIYAFSTVSLDGSMFYMLNHGFSTAALFLVVGMLAKRRGSYDIAAFGGVQKVAPVMSGALLITAFAALGLPGMSTFVSEFLVLSGAWQQHRGIAGVAVFGTVLAAVYSLTWYQKTMTGTLRDDVAADFTGKDLTAGERAIMAVVLATIIALGIFPKSALSAVEQTSTHVMQQMGAVDPQPGAGKGAK
ncbi:MAG: NADH-quinone oxidoreductase subunit M [Propionibacteriaceae bacterium]